jgi:hypothetical protein
VRPSWQNCRIWLRPLDEPAILTQASRAVWQGRARLAERIAVILSLNKPKKLKQIAAEVYLRVDPIVE